MTSERERERDESLDDCPVRDDCILNNCNYSTLDKVAVGLPGCLLHIILVHNLHTTLPQSKIFIFWLLCTDIHDQYNQTKEPRNLNINSITLTFSPIRAFLSMIALFTIEFLPMPMGMPPEANNSFLCSSVCHSRTTGSAFK